MKLKPLAISSLILISGVASASVLQEQMRWIDVTPGQEYNTDIEAFSISLPITKEQLETAESEGANFVLSEGRVDVNHIFRQDFNPSDMTSGKLYAITTMEIGKAYCEHINPDSKPASFTQLQNTHTHLVVKGEFIADYGWPFERMGANYYHNISIPDEGHLFVKPTAQHIYQFINMHIGGSSQVLSDSKFGLISCVKPL